MKQKSLEIFIPGPAGRLEGKYYKNPKFGSPVAIFAGFIFGKWIGTLLLVIGLSIGATFLYIFANFFLKDIVKEKFSNRFSNLNEKFKKNEFLYFLAFRFLGGIPFFISNILQSI